MPSDATSNQAFRESIARDYFHSTSARGSAASQADFDGSVAGLRRRLAPWLDVHGRAVLDLGSGTGELCRVVLDAGAVSATGVNLSADEIAFARTQSKATFVHSDITEYLDHAPAASIDRIFALNILEHLDKDQLARVLRGAWRVLRPRGSLVGMVPNATSPYGGMTRYWDMTHENAFTPSSVIQLARFIGYADRVDFRECGPVPYGFISSIRYALWQGMRLGIKFRLLVELASTKGGVYTADMLFRLWK